MDNIIIEQGEFTFTFRVEVEQDDGAGKPWENEDGHGPVSDWETRSKKPGEMILNTDRGSKRFYDFAEACRIARRDGWDHTASRPKPAPDCPDCACVQDGKCLCIPSKPSLQETKRQRAARAAIADYEFLRGFCNDEWSYVSVAVTLLDESGEETNVSESLGCVEDLNDYPAKIAQELAEGLVKGFGTDWGTITRETYGMLTKGESA